MTETLNGPDVLAHEGEWTAEDWLALPETDQRCEVIEGVLIVSPSGRPTHSRIIIKLAQLLEHSNPTLGALWVLTETGVRVGRDVFEPDVLVATAGDDLPVTAAALRLAVEVESPSSLGNDRIMKPNALSAAGIECYWRISRDPITVHVYQLLAGTMVKISAATGEEVVEVLQPWPLRFRVSQLEP